MYKIFLHYFGYDGFSFALVLIGYAHTPWFCRLGEFTSLPISFPSTLLAQKSSQRKTEFINFKYGAIFFFLHFLDQHPSTTALHFTLLYCPVNFWRYICCPDIQSKRGFHKTLWFLSRRYQRGIHECIGIMLEAYLGCQLNTPCAKILVPERPLPQVTYMWYIFRGPWIFHRAAGNMIPERVRKLYSNIRSPSR